MASLLTARSDSFRLACDNQDTLSCEYRACYVVEEVSLADDSAQFLGNMAKSCDVLNASIAFQWIGTAFILILWITCVAEWSKRGPRGVSYLLDVIPSLTPDMVRSRWTGHSCTSAFDLARSGIFWENSHHFRRHKGPAPYAAGIRENVH